MMHTTTKTTARVIVTKKKGHVAAVVVDILFRYHIVYRVPNSKNSVSLSMKLGRGGRSTGTSNSSEYIATCSTVDLKHIAHGWI